METNFNRLFLEISSHLTGFSKTELRATGMLESYLNTILLNTDKENINYFFLEVGTLLKAKHNDDSLEAAIALNFMQDSSYGGLAKNIITLWYTGNWDGHVVSAASYIQGLMWNAAHTHPPGAKQPGYGSWAQLPLTVQKSTPKTAPDGE